MTQYIDETIMNILLLPDKLKISTMSTTCKLDVDINLDNIDNYMELSENEIVTIKYNQKIKSLDKAVLKKKKKKSTNKNFFNQLTLEIRPNSSNPIFKINIKLFKNGSVQMSGCKSIRDCNKVLHKLIINLQKEYGVIENNQIVDKPFVNNKDKINVNNFKITMINSNFNINYLINRESLYNILLSKKTTCRYEPCIHACVNIKYTTSEAPKPVSIFVFQSGNLIITGAKTINQILECYKYITEILAENYDRILKKDFNSILENEELIALLTLKDNNNEMPINVRVI